MHALIYAMQPMLEEHHGAKIQNTNHSQYW